MPKELELKYLVDKNSRLIEVLDLLYKKGFRIKYTENILNEDTYYDTNNLDLLKSGCSLRTRLINKKCFVTLKLNGDENQDYLDRKEIEVGSIDDSFDSITSSLKDIDFDISKICPFPFLKTKNNRLIILLKRKDVYIEVAYDKVRYHNLSNDKKHTEAMIEIEAKENTTSKVLKEINKSINNKLGFQLCSESKYERAMKLTSSSLQRKKLISN